MSRRALMPAGQRPRGRRRDGAVLLEVVLALILFFGASLVLLSALNASLRTAQRVSLEAQAADLAVTLMSEIQMGLVAPSDDGPNDYGEEDESLAGWTWEIVTDPVEDEAPELELPQLLEVEIIIRNDAEHYAYRLAQLMPAEGAGAAEAGGLAARPVGGQ